MPTKIDVLMTCAVISTVLLLLIFMWLLLVVDRLDNIYRILLQLT